MNARTSWTARPDRTTGEANQPAAGDGSDLPLEDILEARFDDEGRLAQIGSGARQRVAQRVEPRPPNMSPEELERAVQKLALGLEALERNGAVAAGAPDVADTAERRGPGRELVSSSLDRLEARLEELRRRLRRRSPAPAAPPQTEASAPPEREPMTEPRRVDPSLAAEPEPAEMSAERGELRRRTEAEAARVLELAREAEEQRAEAERMRAGAGEAAAEPQPPAAAIRPDAEGDLADMRRRLMTLEARVDGAHRNGDGGRVEPLRQELLALLKRIEELGKDGRSMASAVEQVRRKIDEVETKANAARNLAGNRVGELQDRLGRVTQRLAEMESEIPGFDAVRENQIAILERFDRMEGVVHRLAAPDQILERVEGLRRQLQAVPSQRELARIEERIAALGERVEALPDAVSDRPILETIEAQLQTVAAEFAAARREGEGGWSEARRELVALHAGLQQVAETGRAPDLGALESRLAEIGGRLEEERRASAEAAARLEARVAELAAAVQAREEALAADIVSGLGGRIDGLAEAIQAQDVRGARGDIAELGRRLEEINRSLAEQAEHLARPHLEPLEGRLDALQARLDYIAETAEMSGAQLGPFAQKLDDIAARVSGLASGAAEGELLARLAGIEERLAGLSARAAEPRAVHNQLENIISRLELLKGRSIDPARLLDMFDRVDAALRSGPSDERFAQLAEALQARGGAAIPEELIRRLEERLDRQAPGALVAERFDRLEQKLEALGRVSAGGGAPLDADELVDLRDGIVALRRELRSLPVAGADATLGATLQQIAARLEQLPEERLVTAGELERQIERIASVLDDPSHSRLALAHIETSLRTIEERIGEIPRGREAAAGDEGELDTVAEIARALSADVGALRGAAEASERKTKDALEAVQGTLEAVVKRMAFLERDGEGAPVGSGADLPTAATASAAAAGALASGAEAAQPGEGPVQPALPTVTPTAEAKAEGEATRDVGSGGLFNRFTSSQLLKRATGGRAESFSPEAESEEPADLPLEPGTNTPLDSALTDAPSSDTALFSGNRTKGRVAVARGGAELQRIGSPRHIEPAGNEDFLAAARRAAQAAAAEAADAERARAELRQGGRLRRAASALTRRRRAVLACALAIAATFAAVQLLRNHLAGQEAEIAAQSAGAEDATPAAQLTPVSPEPSATGLSAVDGEGAAAEPSPPETAPAEAVSPTPPAAAGSDLAAPPVPPENAAADPAPAETAAADAAPPASAEEDAAVPAEPTDTAAVQPPDAPADPAPAAAAPSQSTDLPPPVGPDALQQAATAGDPAAAFEVAARYAEGRGVPEDMTAAVAWYRRAAEAGLAPAQYRLGSIYEKGLGVPKDAAAAQDWYRRAADAGNVNAMHNLAVLYAEGAGGTPDLERAADLFRQAAERGVRDSQFNLAILHARGLGVPQNMVEAYKWFAVAARSGDAESAKRRDIIAAALSPEALEEAEAAAAAFKPVPLDPAANDVTGPEGGWGEDAATVLRSEDELIALVQKLLADQGYDPGPPDGLLGQKTVEAITEFQAKSGLPMTGKVDTTLVSALQEQST